MAAVVSLTSICLFLGLVLALSDYFLKVEVDARIETINELLPQMNCGACGHPGCSGLAEAIVEQKGRVSDCKPISDLKKQEIYEYLKDVEGPSGEKIDLIKVK